jgi:hypothetical protein
VLGAGWLLGHAQRGSAGGRTRAGTCTPALPCCGTMDTGVGGSEPSCATEGVVLGAGVAARVHTEGLSRGHTKAGTCMPASPCYGTMGVEAGGSEPPPCNQRCGVGSGVATRAHAEGLSRRLHQGQHLHTHLALLQCRERWGRGK